MATYPDPIPDALPADPIDATEWLAQLYAAEYAPWDKRIKDSIGTPGAKHAIISNRIGWDPPVVPRQPFGYVTGGTPPATFKPVTGWHDATEQTSSDLCTQTLALAAAVETLRATAGDPSANASAAHAAQVRADSLANSLANLTAEIPPSSRAWLEQLRKRLPVAKLRPQPAATTPLQPRR